MSCCTADVYFFSPEVLPIKHHLASFLRTKFSNGESVDMDLISSQMWFGAHDNMCNFSVVWHATCGKRGRAQKETICILHMSGSYFVTIKLPLWWHIWHISENKKWKLSLLQIVMVNVNNSDTSLCLVFWCILIGILSIFFSFSVKT